MNETIRQEQELVSAILQQPEEEEKTAEAEEKKAEEAAPTEEIEPTDEATVEEDDLSVEDDTSEEVNEEDDLDEDVDEEDYEDVDEEDLDEDEESQTEDLIDVIVDGETRQVSLDELKQSYSGTEYIKKQVEDASIAKKEAQTHLEFVGSAANEYAMKLNQLSEILDAATPSEPDWDKLKADNPELYNKQLAEWNDLQRKRQAVEEAKQEEEQARIKRNADLTAKYNQEQAELAIQKMPHLADQAVAQTTGEKWQKKVHEYGYTDAEFALVTDHRMLHLLDDFIKVSEELEEIKSRRKKAKEMNKEKGKRRVKRSVRPNAATATSRKGERQRKRESRENRAWQTGKVEDVAATLIVEPDG